MMNGFSEACYKRESNDFKMSAYAVRIAQASEENFNKAIKGV